ncbi:hypothetical protein D3C76_1038670 [compost metagenome]
MCTLLAAFEAASRVLDTVEHGAEAEAVAFAGRHFDFLAQATAQLAGTARAFTQFFAPDHHGAGVLGGFHRHGVHAAWEGGGTQAVHRRTGAHAAAVEHQHFGVAAIAVAFQRANAQVQIPQGAGALGWHFAWQAFVQRTEYQVRHEVTEHMAHRHRRRVLGIEDAAFRRSHFERCQRRSVVRDLWRNDALEAVAGIGLGVAQRHVDAELAHARRTGEVALDAVRANGDGHRQGDRDVVAVEGHAVAVGAVRQRLEAFQGGAAAVLEDEPADVLQVVQLELF